MMMNKEDEVEVKSEEDGFQGAWFKAVLEENLTKSGRKKIRIRYLTLLQDNGSTPLTETIDQSFIRPVPPVEMYNDVVLEEGVVVDADHKDGWWTGVVIKEVKQDKFLVYFDLPPDIMQFDKKQLRAHIDWTGWKWVRPEIEELSMDKFCTGTLVEVSSVIDKVETGWTPAMIVTEMDEEDGKKMFMVKYCDKYGNCNGDEARPNENVELSRIRPAPLASSFKEYELLECVEAFRGSSWRQGLVRGILSEKRYMVSIGITKEESVFKHSELRPFLQWEDGIWRKGAITQQSVKETPLSSLRKKSMRACSSGVKSTTPKSGLTKCLKRTLDFEENAETILTKADKTVTVAVAAAEEPRKKKAVAVTNGDAPLAIIPQVKPKAKESVSSSVTPSPVVTDFNHQVKSIAKDSVSSSGTPSPVVIALTATPLKQPVAGTGKKITPEKTPEQVKNQSAMETGKKTSPEKIPEQVKNQSAMETDSTQEKMSEEENSEEKSRKRKREQEEQHSDPNETDGTCNGSEAEIDTTSQNICTDGDIDQILSSWIEQLPDHTPNIVKTSSAAITHVDERQGGDTVTSLPFAKKSPYWKTCESTDGFKTVPQRPHFSPLCDAKEDLREWSAVGMMVTFYGLLDEVKDLKLDVPQSKLNSLSVSFTELEKHGFDVEAPQLRISKMLSLQEGRGKNSEKKKCFVKEIEEEETGIRNVEEELAELKRKMIELQRQEAVAIEKKEAGEKKMVEMKSSVVTIDQEIEETEIEFQRTASAPW